MAEEIINKTITTAPDYLQPGIEKYLEGATAQAGQAIDTSQFAPQVAGLCNTTTSTTTSCNTSRFRNFTI